MQGPQQLWKLDLCSLSRDYNQHFRPFFLHRQPMTKGLWGTTTKSSAIFSPTCKNNRVFKITELKSHCQNMLAKASY